MNENTENQLVRTNKIDWKPLSEPDSEGVYIKVLQYDAATRRAPTFLLKFDAGATYPAHNHPGGEEIYVLEGDIHLGKDHLFAGDYLYTAPNGVHAVRTDGGCVIFIKTPQAVEILPNRKNEEAKKD